MVKNKPLLVIMAIIFLCIISGIYLTIKGISKYQDYQTRYESALNKLALKLNVIPDWSVVRNEIYCNKMPLGITFEEIRQELSDIMPIDIVRTDDVYSYYTLYFLDFNLILNDMALVFDSENKLKEKLLWTGLGDKMPVECP